MPESAEETELRSMVERSRRSDRIAILGSGFVAVLGLAVSTYNVYLQRVQIRAQVWPHLEMNRNDSNGFVVEARNTGVGPAILQGLRVSAGDRHFEHWDEVRDFAFAADPGLRDRVERYKESLVGRVVPAGTPIRAFALQWPPDASDADAPAMRRVLERLWSLRIEACYCSTLGECWVSARGPDTPVSKCPSDRLDWAE